MTNPLTRMKDWFTPAVHVAMAKSGRGGGLGAGALLGLGVLALPGAGWAAPCSDATFSTQVTLNWPTPDAPAPYDQTVSTTLSGVSVRIRLNNTGTWNGSSTRPSLSGVNLALGGTFDPATENITVQLNFTNTNNNPLPVKQIEFIAYDIDRWVTTGIDYRDTAILSTGTWTPGTGWTGTGGGTSTVTAPNTNTGSSPCNGLSSNSACSAAANSGTASSVNSFTLTYKNANTTATDPYQEIALSPVTFCVNAAMVPVTIASVNSRQEESGLSVEWTTTMEKANAGFNIYGDINGVSTKLNETLIPSHVVDAEEPQSYAAHFPRVVTNQIVLEDIDIRGRGQRHGPFVVGEKHGAAPKVKRVDVAAIQRENTAAPSQASPSERSRKVAAAPHPPGWR